MLNWINQNRINDMVSIVKVKLSESELYDIRRALRMLIRKSIMNKSFRTFRKVTSIVIRNTKVTTKPNQKGEVNSIDSFSVVVDSPVDPGWVLTVPSITVTVIFFSNGSLNRWAL